MTSYPEVATASVDLGLPNRVEISLVERAPMVEWDDAGRKWWLSEGGIAMLRMGEWPGAVRVVSSTPVLSFGADPTQAVISQDILQAALSLHQQTDGVGSLVYDTQHGLGFEDDHGRSVYFGIDGDMAMKCWFTSPWHRKLNAKGFGLIL